MECAISRQLSGFLDEENRIEERENRIECRINNTLDSIDAEMFAELDFSDKTLMLQNELAFLLARKEAVKEVDSLSFTCDKTFLDVLEEYQDSLRSDMWKTAEKEINRR